MTELTKGRREALQRKLDQLAKLAAELDAAAKELYGPQGNLFFESAGDFHLMDGDADVTADRQKHVKLSSTLSCSMGCGAW